MFASVAVAAVAQSVECHKFRSINVVHHSGVSSNPGRIKRWNHWDCIWKLRSMKNPSSSICGVKNENKWCLQVFKMNLWTFLHEQSSHVCVCQVSFILLCSPSSSTFIRVVHWTNHFGKLSFRWATIKNNIFSSRGKEGKQQLFVIKRTWGNCWSRQDWFVSPAEQ